MKKYDIIKNRVEFPYNRKNEICEGCTAYQDTEPELISSFNDVETAIEELKKYHSSVEKYVYNGTWFYVTEYMLCENEHDEDGEISADGDVIAWSSMDAA